MACSQQVSTVVGLSDKIVKEYWRALTIRY